MSRISGKDTKPELLVRSLLHQMGYRFRVHKNDLPGKLDIALPKHKKVIFVHGCFWHGHEDCSRSKRPSTNVEFWNKKIDATIERDKKNPEFEKSRMGNADSLDLRDKKSRRIEAQTDVFYGNKQTEQGR